MNNIHLFLPNSMVSRAQDASLRSQAKFFIAISVYGLFHAPPVFPHSGRDEYHLVTDVCARVYNRKSLTAAITP
jgi:hypothetical protein